MPRPDHSRDALLTTTARLLRRQGYAATGTARILADSRVTTGSLYHYFPGGKEELAEVALAAAGAEVTELLRTWLDSGVPLADVVRRWLRAKEADLTADPRDGCPIAPTAIEAVNASPRLRTVATRTFTDWRELIAARLREEGRPDESAAETASNILALLEGALLLARTSGETGPLRAAATAAERLLAQ